MASKYIEKVDVSGARALITLNSEIAFCVMFDDDSGLKALHDMVRDMRSVELPPSVQVIGVNTKEIVTFFEESHLDAVTEKDRREIEKDQSKVMQILESALQRGGFQKRNRYFFIKVVAPDASADKCTRYVEITAANLSEYRHLLPVLYSMCPGYISGWIEAALSEGYRMFIVKDDADMPCATAIVKEGVPNRAGVEVKFLCSIVKSTGRNLFEHIVRTMTAEGKKTLAIEPANYELHTLYKGWMGDRFKKIYAGYILEMQLKGNTTKKRSRSVRTGGRSRTRLKSKRRC